jgi:hypothetical protein
MHQPAQSKCINAAESKRSLNIPGVHYAFAVRHEPIQSDDMKLAKIYSSLIVCRQSSVNAAPCSSASHYPISCDFLLATGAGDIPLNIPLSAPLHSTEFAHQVQCSTL